MPTFRCIADDTRVYPVVGEVAPGDEIEADTNPDPSRFEPASKTNKAPKE